MRSKLLALILVAMVFPVHSAQKFTIKAGESITAYVSKVGLNRIVVTGDRIASIKGLANQFLLEKDQKLGEVYIKPSGIMDEPIHLYLTTEQGHTYLLSLLTHDMAPDSIILEPPQPKPMISAPHSREMLIVDLIKAIHLERPYKSLAKQHGYKVEKYRVINLSRKTRTLCEQNFYTQGVVAISIVRKKLLPNAGTDIYFIKELK